MREECFSFSPHRRNTVDGKLTTSTHLSQELISKLLDTYKSYVDLRSEDMKPRYVTQAYTSFILS